MILFAIITNYVDNNDDKNILLCMFIENSYLK